MKIEFDNERPIYMQLVDSIRLEIISGRIKPGEKLLSVREYALKVRVNPNTMQKALGELEDEGMIYTERTNGKFITTNKKKIELAKENYVKEKIKTFMDDLNDIGINKEDAIKYLETK